MHDARLATGQIRALKRHGSCLRATVGHNARPKFG